LIILLCSYFAKSQARAHLYFEHNKRLQQCLYDECLPAPKTMTVQDPRQ